MNEDMQQFGLFSPVPAGPQEIVYERSERARNYRLTLRRDGTALAILAAIAWLSYINEKVLPAEVRALVVNGIEESTGKKVSLKSLKFNIFKGLVHARGNG